MSTPAVTQAVPDFATFATPASSCGSKVSKALTVVGAVLATAVVLAEGSRFLDLSANIFQHLPSMEINVTIGVAGVTAMIAGQVLGCVDERKKAARALEQAEVLREVAKTIAEAQKANQEHLGQLIALLQESREKLLAIDRHRAAEESKMEVDPISEELKKWGEQKFKSNFTVRLISPAITKFDQMCNQVQMYLEKVKNDPHASTVIKAENLVHLSIIIVAIEHIANFRLESLEAGTECEKKFEEIMKDVTVDPSKPITDTLNKIIYILDSLLPATQKVAGEDVLNNNNNQGKQ